MHKLISYFIRYPIWVKVMMFTVIAFGLMSMSRMRFSFFPEVTPDIIFVQVAYPGASPEEVAEGVILKIEENLDGLDGVDRITSVSRENIGSITVETALDSDIDQVLADVKNAVDRISSFPVGSEKPVIFEQKFRSRAVSIVLFGSADLYNLKYITEAFRDKLLDSPIISQINIEGLPNLEISIEVSESDLRRYNLTFEEIAAAVRDANINISGGKFETGQEELLIRAWGRDYHASELLDIPIRGRGDGVIVHLGDIANVREKWEDSPVRRYYNDQDGLILNIDQTKDEDIIAIADFCNEQVEIFNQVNSEVTAKILDDRTIPLRQRIDLLVKNGIIGLILVVAALGFFLNLRLSFWVAISIPFSFAGMFIIGEMAGITINVISLFGMIIVVGILVDDAIVVAERVYALYEQGVHPIKAAIDGTSEVMAPVATSVITTVIAFTPFFFLDGMMGRFIGSMAIVVIASLLFSLFEAFFILPSHLAHSKGLHPHKEDPPMRRKIERFIKYMTHTIYASVLKKVMRYKYITVVIPAALIMITFGLLKGGIIGTTFFPFIDGDTLPINVSLVTGRQEADTENILKQIEDVCWRINDEIKAERADGLDVITGIKREIGSNQIGDAGGHAGMLLVQLLDGETRDMGSYDISNRIRQEIGPIPETQNITFGRVGHFGKPVSISLLGNDYTQLNKARQLLVDELINFTTLKDVTTSDEGGRREVNITLKPRAHALGLTLRDIAGQVRQGFFGHEIQRIQRGRDEIRVWVRYRDEDRSELAMLDKIRIRTPEGEFPFSELATYKVERGIVSINRLERKREIKIEANMADVKTDLPPILDEIRVDVLPSVLAQVEGVSYSFEGQSRGQAKTTNSMKTAFPIALLGMLILIILVFRSLAQALMIFSLIPIGILGAIWGHGIQGLQLNILSIYGIIALSGIIINDSIVFVDKINRNLRDGLKVEDAVFQAGLSRLRPIILTTMTTSLGLAPLIMETSRQAQFLIPMAVSVAYGLLFGTFILLLILPASFLVFNSVRVNWINLIYGKKLNQEEVEPAVKELEVSA